VAERELKGLGRVEKLKPSDFDMADFKHHSRQSGLMPRVRAAAKLIRELRQSNC
jgi:hypothetical protein